ncbi:hypothetical protein HMPREF9969_0647 [Prevotella sp. oral taxon 306 str. F0472]|uniref:hypothetical protein n=1 Tax=Prevotella sp. oral taxon 306 TaxID=712461 RepID=UPI00025BCDAD|nr:hypothetical protein [Prevotella sp. oral taxon 306]EID34196.1 hypothetical protein HMPREF9969_0647 [Prevotella sp. oral taxon 306 str. F0472]
MDLKKDFTNLIKSLYKCHSNLIIEQKALVLFNIGVCCVAINNEADMLYIKMGWELIDFEDDNTIYSFMIINQYGIKVLESMKYNIVKYDSIIYHNDILSTVAELQQSLDYLRINSTEKSIDYPIVAKNLSVEGMSFIRTLRLSSLHIDRNNISVLIDNYETVTLANEYEWNFSKTEKTILESLKVLFQEQYTYILYMVQHYNIAVKTQQSKNSILHNLFLKKKSEIHNGNIVCVKCTDYYLTFDDDAIAVHNLLNNAYLYDIKTLGVRGNICVIINPTQIIKLCKQQNNISIISYSEGVPLYSLGLKESFLNIRYKKEISYIDTIIRKHMNGDFTISAVFNGYSLPEQQISSVVGGYYFRLPSCEEKEAVLSAIVHQTYDDIIYQLT